MLRRRLAGAFGDLKTTDPWGRARYFVGWLIHLPKRFPGRHRWPTLAARAKSCVPSWTHHHAIDKATHQFSFVCCCCWKSVVGENNCFRHFSMMPVCPCLEERPPFFKFYSAVMPCGVLREGGRKAHAGTVGAQLNWMMTAVSVNRRRFSLFLSHFLYSLSLPLSLPHSILSLSLFLPLVSGCMKQSIGCAVRNEVRCCWFNQPCK